MAAEAFLVASVIVSFLAGIVALAMPCCFSVLLPSYFASVFKKRTAILRMTSVFAIGIAAVLIPITLGITAISTYVSLNHALLFVVGGFFMLFLGVSSLLGIQLVPMFTPDVDLQRTGALPVFALGAFSGVASSCCAPVLAGIMVLTALASSLAGALAVGTAYVAGMVFPLFVTGAFMDRTTSVQRFLSGKMVATPVGEIHSSKLLTGSIFISMGAMTAVLGLADQMLPTPGADIFNIYESVIQNAVEGAVSSPVGQVVLAGFVVTALGLYALRRLRGSSPGERTSGAEGQTQEVHI